MRASCGGPLADRHFDDGAYSDALPHYLDALAGALDATRRARALARVGWMSFASGRTDLAEAYLTEALSTDPGYEVAESGNGENAIVQTTEFKPDFAIIDYGLPDINGLEVGQQMKEATDSHIVLGLLTGSDGRELRSEADRIGFRGFFVKPISIREICKWISENSG